MGTFHHAEFAQIRALRKYRKQEATCKRRAASHPRGKLNSEVAVHDDDLLERQEKQEAESVNRSTQQCITYVSSRSSTNARAAEVRKAAITVTAKESTEIRRGVCLRAKHSFGVSAALQPHD